MMKLNFSVLLFMSMLFGKGTEVDLYLNNGQYFNNAVITELEADSVCIAGFGSNLMLHINQIDKLIVERSPQKALGMLLGGVLGVVAGFTSDVEQNDKYLLDPLLNPVEVLFNGIAGGFVGGTMGLIAGHLMGIDTTHPFSTYDLPKKRKVIQKLLLN